jgi:hypothetical protein
VPSDYQELCGGLWASSQEKEEGEKLGRSLMQPVFHSNFFINCAKIYIVKFAISTILSI